MPLDLKGVDVAGLNSLFPQKPKRNPIVAGLSAGVDQLQGLGYNALAAGADALGLQRGRDWLLDRAALNEDEAYANGRPDLEMVEDQDLGSAIPFAAYQIAKQVPQIGAALGLAAVAPQAAIPAGLSRLGAVLPRAVGGGGAGAATNFAARRAAVEAGNRFARNLTGGLAFGTGMGAGALYGESVDAGDPSPYAALAAAPFYGLAEGVPTAVLGGTLARGAFRGNMAARMAQAGGVNALGGATSELTQNEMEMAFNPTLSPEEIASRRLNSAVVGGLAEGTIGSLGGIRRPAAPRSLLPDANPGRDDTPPPPPDTQPRLDPYAMPGTQANLFPWSDEGTASPLPSYGQSSALDNLRSDLGELTAMAEQAYEAGDRPQLEAVNAAIRQVQQQIRALEPRDTSRAPLLPSGVNEMVSGQPIELFNYELDNNLLPFVDAGFQPPQVDPVQQALLWEPQGGLPFDRSPLPPSPPQQPAAKRRLLTADELSYEGQPLDGEVERVEQDARRTETRAALRRANGGRWSKAIEGIAGLIGNKDWVGLDTFLQGADINPQVLDTALELSRSYQQQDVNTMAQEGLRRAQPGVIVGTPPSAEASADAVYDTQERIRTEEVGQRQRQQLTGAIADTDARALGAQEQRTTAARRQVLDSALEGAQNAGNARNRFIKSLRKAGFRDTIVRPEEQAVITRYFDLAQTLPAEEQVTDNTEMEAMVPERGAAPPAPLAKKGTKPERDNENRSFQLTSPPSTEADLVALEKAQAKRDRKAAAQATEEPPPVAEGTTGGKQGILFTKQGKPAAAADQERTPPPPRKSRVKVKVGEQEAELEVDDAPAKIEALKKDIDKYERFVACLRKK